MPPSPGTCHEFNPDPGVEDHPEPRAAALRSDSRNAHQTAPAQRSRRPASRNPSPQLGTYPILRSSSLPLGLFCIHIEDFAQVFRKHPERKHADVSFANIGQIVVSYANADDIDQFIGRLAFSALIGNGDMHLKNWSLTYPHERTPKLAPLYDMLSGRIPFRSRP